MVKPIKLFCKNNINNKIYLFIFVLLFVYVVFLLKIVLLPFFLSVLCALIFNPLVTRISSIKIYGRNIPRWFSVIIIYSLMATIVILILLFFIPVIYHEVINLINELTIIVSNIDDDMVRLYAQRIGDFCKKHNIPIDIMPVNYINSLSTSSINSNENLISFNLTHMFNILYNKLMQYGHYEFSDIIFQLQSILLSIIDFFLQFILMFMITGFLLIDNKSIYNLISILNKKSCNNNLNNVLNKINVGLLGVVQGQVLICLLNGLLTFLGLLILHVKFVFLLATLAGIFSLIPIFGSIISTIPICLVALTNSVYTACFALIWIVIIHIVEANILNPNIMGTSAKIHPVLIVLSLIIGKYLYGMIGAMIAVPIISIILSVLYSCISILDDDSK